MGFLAAQDQLFIDLLRNWWLFVQYFIEVTHFPALHARSLRGKEIAEEGLDFGQTEGYILGRNGCILGRMRVT
jgi:hypothetical protein